MRAYDVIEAKRGGRDLTYDEISFFITEYCDGAIPDYQASALLMAIYLKGLNERETIDLTQIMANSGKQIDLSGIKGIKVDKHSTGGVGDKTTMIVGPIVASCGIAVPKMAGRGLGHTGGTIDKLDSIPGFKTNLSEEEFIDNIESIGIAISEQTGDLVPADKKLYQLRDATATVDNISLIASSIMSKKIAAGADRILLDVTTGSGAFMKTIDKAIELAALMVKIGEKAGKRTSAIITDMDTPLGTAIGNSLEVIEAIETLKGNGSAELRDICIEIAARMLELAEKGDISKCRSLALEALKNGKALEKFSQMVEQQGGNKEIVNDYNLFGSAKYQRDIISENEGYISSINTESIGLCSMYLGAGRETKESKIDYTAGLVLKVKKGSKVKKGDVLARLFTNKEETLERAESVFKSAINYTDEPVAATPLILALVDAGGTVIF